MNFEENVRSPRPAEVVWPLLQDFANTASWDPGVARVERLTPGPIRVGTRWTVHVRMGPWTAPMAYEVVSLDERRIVLSGRGRLIEAVDDIEVAPLGDGSVVTWRARITPRGLLAPTAPLWRGALQRVAADAMEGLRRWLA